MECSQAVQMLMLLMPCEQSGGKSPEAVVAERLEPAPVVQADPVLDDPQESESVHPPNDADTAPPETRQTK